MHVFARRTKDVDFQYLLFTTPYGLDWEYLGSEWVGIMSGDEVSIKVYFDLLPPSCSEAVSSSTLKPFANIQ